MNLAFRIFVAICSGVLFTFFLYLFASLWWTLRQRGKMNTPIAHREPTFALAMEAVLLERDKYQKDSNEWLALQFLYVEFLQIEREHIAYIHTVCGKVAHTPTPKRTTPAPLPNHGFGVQDDEKR